VLANKFLQTTTSPVYVNVLMLVQGHISLKVRKKSKYRLSNVGKSFYFITSRLDCMNVMLPYYVSVRGVKLTPQTPQCGGGVAGLRGPN